MKADKATDTQLFQVDCAPDCGFMVRSSDKAEVINMTKKHAAEKHDEIEMTNEQVEEIVTEVIAM